jgi:glycosyltransferase involved in cell wall biosynthesis
MYVAYNKKNIITAISEQPFELSGHMITQWTEKVPKADWHKLIGTKIKLGDPKQVKDLRVAFICNWNDFCGISTYTKFLVDAMRPKVKELCIFSENIPVTREPDGADVVRCWDRGTSMKPALDKIMAWNPDFIIIQHEFGIFPKATYFLQMLQAIEDVPYVVTMHSVYEHLDKAVCTSAVKNIVVHSHEGEKILRKTGNNSNIFVIPHGCIELNQSDKEELWNIFQTPYAMVQFGFGFFYKGVDKVLDAVHYLKKNDPKFKDIFYTYLCSDNVHTSIIHAKYHDFLLDKIDKLGLHDNAVIIKKFQTEQTINHYLRTAKIALFPYVSDPKNTVYGASGAIRVAMANNIPVIASNCHQFDDLEGVVPRPNDYVELAKEIDHVFSSEKYKKNLLNKANQYIEDNNWPVSADRYLALYDKLTS